MAGNNRVQYTIGVNADTKQADAQLAKLSSTLDKIQKTAAERVTVDLKIDRAAESARILQSSLQKAVNVDTGKINLAKFNSELKSANVSLGQLTSNLVSAGGDGSVAFTQMASVIAQAEVPIKRMNSTLANFSTTLKNTVKWELASKMVHGLESFLSGAISYAKDLNGTLNDIRVVTGASIADMGKFANQANKMAKELSATTQEIAKASLIYYQQGDSAELAAKKAAITTKAANVAFTASAQEMSQMLTAVWNSFQMGEDQLEHAVDVMAILGATTASSMEEMATAMQKVAATANNVGVSMEQMSAIVATSASVTRQAPQVIGTAWNTILSRLGGLKLGETLEDGVDLNKYSKALASIGVQVLDATGNLKDMGGVVDEIGAKWDTMTRAQQSALAQTIGGTRQYTQILAFFDNFEKYQKNLETANNANGALNKQAEIYAQSWEAASKRQKAALQGVFREVIDDEAIIKVTNSITNLIERLGDVIKGFGGVQGILLTIGNVAMKVFGSQIANGIDTALTRMKSFGGAIGTAWNLSSKHNRGHSIKDEAGNTIRNKWGHNVISVVDEKTGAGVDAKTRLGRFVGAVKQQGNYEMREQRSAIQYARTQLNQLAEPNTQAEKVAQTSAQNLLNLKEKLLNTEYKMSVAQQQSAQAAIDNYGQQTQKLTELIAKHEELEGSIHKETADLAQTLYSSKGNQSVRRGKGKTKPKTYAYAGDVKADIDKYIENAAVSQTWENIGTNYAQLQFSDNYKTDSFNWNVYNKMLGGRVAQMSAVVNEGQANELKQIYADVNTAQKAGDWSAVETHVNKLIDKMEEFGIKGSKAAKEVRDKLTNMGADGTAALEQMDQKVDDIVTSARQIGNQKIRTDESEDEANKSLKEQKTFADKASQAMQKTAAAAMSALSSFNAMSTAVSTLQDETASFGQKATSILSTVGNLTTAWSQGLVSGIAATVAAGASLVIGIVEGVQARENALRVESATALKKQVNDLKENHEKVSEIKQNYEELKSAFEAGDLTRADYVTKLGEITQSLDLEGTHVAELTQNYKDLEKAIENATGKRLAADVEEATTAYRKVRSQGQSLMLSSSQTEGNLAKFQITDNGLKADNILWDLVGQNQGNGRLERSNNVVAYKNYLGLNGQHQQNEKALFKLMFGEDGLGGLVSIGDGDNLEFDLSNTENAITILERLYEIRDKIAQQDTLEGRAANDLINTKIFQDLVTNFEAYVIPLKDTQNILMESVANEALNKHKNTLVKAYQSGEINRDTLIDEIYGLFEENADIDVSIYGEESAKKATTQYVDAFLKTFAEIEIPVSNEKASANLKDQVFEFLDATLGKDSVQAFRNHIEEYWTKEILNGQSYSDLFSQIGFGDIDWIQFATGSHLNGRQFAQSLSAQSVYNQAVNRYTNAQSYMSRQADVGSDEILSIASLLFKDSDYESLNLTTKTGESITSYAELVTAFNNNNLDKLATLSILFESVNTNLEIWRQNAVSAMTDLNNAFDQTKDLSMDDYATEVLKLPVSYEEFEKARKYIRENENWKPSDIQFNDNISEVIQNQIYEDALRQVMEKKVANMEISDGGKYYTQLQGYYNENGTLSEDGIKKLNDLLVEEYRDDENIKNEVYNSDEFKAGLLAFILDYGEKFDARQKWLNEHRTSTAGAGAEVEEKSAEKIKYEDNVGNAKSYITKIRELNLKKLDGLLDEETAKALGFDDKQRFAFTSLNSEKQEQIITNALKARIDEWETAIAEAEQNPDITISDEDLALLKLYKKEYEDRIRETATKESASAYTAQQYELSQEKERISKLNSGVGILSANVQNDQLTATQSQQLLNSGITEDIILAYNQAETIAQRIVIAQKAQTAYLAEEQAILDTQLQSYTEINDLIEKQKNTDTTATKLLSTDFDINKWVEDTFKDADKATKGQLESILNDLWSNGAITGQSSYSEMYDAILEYCKKSGIELTNAFALIKANGEDTFSNLWRQETNEAKEAAENAVEVWSSAYNAINKARQKAFSGENIYEDVLNDQALYIQMAKQWKAEHGDLAGFNVALKNNEITPGTKDVNEYIRLQQAEAGLNNLLTASNDNEIYQASVYKNNIINEAMNRYLEANPEITREEFMSSDGYKELQAQADQIMKDQLTAILKGYDPTFTDSYIQNVINQYLKKGDKSILEPIIADYNDILSERIYGEETNNKTKEAEAVNAQRISDMEEAQKLLLKVAGGSADKTNWYDDLEQDEIKNLAKYIGISETSLKNWGLENVQAKLTTLADALDDASAASKDFQKALDNGDFEGKTLTSYTTPDGHRIWTDDTNQFKQIGDKTYDTQEEANKIVNRGLGQQVVQDSKTGKWIIAQGGYDERQITSKYGSEADTNYGETTRKTMTEETEATQSEWIANREKEFAALDKVQASYLESGKTVEDQISAWQSFNETIKGANENVLAAAEAYYQAEAGSKEWYEAGAILTEELLKQGNTQKKTTKELELAVAKWKEAYKITDKYGNTLNAAYINLLKYNNGQEAIAETWSKASKTFDATIESMADLRKEAKKLGRDSISDLVEDIEDLSDEAKIVVKEFDEMYDTFDDLQDKTDKKSGLDFSNWTEGLADEMSQMTEIADVNEAFLDQVVTSMTANLEAAQIETAAGMAELQNTVYNSSQGVISSLETAGVDIDTAYNAVVQALLDAHGDATQINLGELVGVGGVDMSQLIAMVAAVMNGVNILNGIKNPKFKVADLISGLQSAYNALSSVQSKYGGGGGGGGGTPQVKNDYTPKSSGGGGGNKTKKSLEKMQEDERERYHEITKRIDEQSKELNKLDKIKSAAFGANHIKAINDEITALKKEKILYQELATEANSNLETNRSALAGFGATFNSDGTVNYDEFMNKITREYNAAVEKYNDTDAEDQKKAKIDLDYAKERYDKAKEALEKYEEDMEKVQDAEENLLDIVNQISAKTLEAIEYKIEVKFDINDRDIKYMQYLRNKWEDVLDKADESMEQMINEAKEYEDNLNVLQTANNDLYKQYNEGNLTAADFAEGLKEINDKSIEMLENLITIKKSIKEAYGNALETANNELEKHTAVLEHSYSMMEKYIQIQQLIGMGTDYTGLKQMYEFQYKSSLASVEAAKLYLDVLKDEEVALQAQIDAYGWTEVLKQQWEDLQERIRDGESDLAEKTNQTLTTAQNAFSNAIKTAIEKFDEFVFGVRGGLSKLEADYQYYQEEQERYLSTSKELYEVAKLNREINGSLDEVTSQLTKTRLRELQEEIKSLSEKNRLTEYDVQMLELQYKYALALEDLEDKKNAKSIVRLTRDDNGNYGYQYTADSEEIDKAAQQVDDVLQQINELAANRTAEIEQAAISAQRNYYDNLEQISNDTSLSIEERQARIEELTQRYAETMQFNQEQYNNATNALLTNQEYVYKRYGTSIMENTGMIQDQMNSAITAMINKTDDWSAYLSTQLQPGGEIYEALETYKQQLDETNISAGLGNRKQAVQNMTKSIDDLTEANEAADKAIRNIADTLDDTLKNINEQTSAWERLTNSIQNAISAYEKLAQTSGSKITALGIGTVNAGVGGESTSTQNKDVYAYMWTDEYGITHTGDWSYDSYGSAMDGAAQSIKAFYSSYLTAGEDDSDTAANKATYEALVDAALGTRSAPSTVVATFLHGGMIDFTGPAWVDGSTSSPESILNAGDTAKMLRMTELIHNIDLEALRLLYESINQSALGMMYPLNGLLNSQSINPFATELQQHVTITAEFPNATDHSEIEQAFEDIVNLAAQYAGRK